MVELTVVIPSRNEEWLKKTVEDILTNAETDIEIIVVLDGSWPVEPLQIDPRVHVIYHNQSIGQRAATNEAARIASGKYIMKLDAHCSMAKGFDKQLLQDIQPDWTIVPTMRNLHVFDWVCKNGHRRYQGPSGICKECNEPTMKDVVWISKKSPQSNSYCFDSEPHFQYFGEYSKRKEGQGQLTETMSLQGSCFMISKENYFKWNVCDESFGSWGSQGIEVSFKTHMNGGKVIVDHNTYYAHMFRTQGGDFGFPYPLSGKQVENAKEQARKLFYEQWPGRVHTLSWLLEKFWPVKGWTEEQLKEVKSKEYVPERLFSEYTDVPVKPSILECTGSFPDEPTAGIIYYTDNRLDEKIMLACQKNLLKQGIPITSCSLKPINFGKNIVFNGERSPLTMFKQILTALENIDTDYVFMAEHDVLYSSSHFHFVPPDKETFYYNGNSWIIRLSDNHAVYYDHRSLNGLCVYRETAITHYKERIELCEKDRFSMQMGYEPFTHHRIPWKNQFKLGDWKSEYPNLDLKHSSNLTPARWSTDKFRDQRNCRNWQEFDDVEIPGWNTNLNEFYKLLS